MLDIYLWQAFMMIIIIIIKFSSLLHFITFFSYMNRDFCVKKSQQKQEFKRYVIKKSQCEI